MARIERLRIRDLWGFLYQLWVKPGHASELVLGKKDLNLHEKLLQAKSPILEIGGPTGNGDFQVCNVLDYRRAGKRVYVLNVRQHQRERYETYGVDLLADGGNLPFATGAISVIFASCLPRDKRRAIIKEASRVLVPGGLLVWRGFRQKDERIGAVHGFEVVQHLWEVEGRLCDEMLRKENDWGMFPLPVVYKSIQQTRRRMEGRLGRLLMRWFLPLPTNPRAIRELKERPYVVVFRKKT